jgi:hypothetical protein
MSGVPRKNNIRVVVEAHELGSYGWSPISGHGTPEGREKHLLSECSRIVSEVKRHIDDIYGVAVAYETEIVCEFCGNEWSDSCTTAARAIPEEPVGFPICCQKAIDEWEQKNGGVIA